MKIFLMSLLVSLNLLAANNIPAVTTKANEPVKAVGTGKSHNFEDLLVNGKYHFADEAVSTVEADKVFDSLIGVRNDFKDRLEDSATNK
jgi:hypothetical protein